jgi:RNA polymerase sigma-70 factor, ECF subfamily
MLRAQLLLTGRPSVIDAAMRGAWRSLEAQLRPYIARRVFCEADVDDIVQEVLTRLQQGAGTLRHSERFGPWVYKVAHHAVADHHRRSKRRAHTEVDLPPDLPASSSEPPNPAAQQVAGCVAPFVALLDTPHREALTLTDLQGLSQKDAADVLGISLSNMKSRVQRAREQLRQAFLACCHIELDRRGHVLECQPKAHMPEGANARRC